MVKQILYLDVCCLNRQFDDQSDSRIAMESFALKQIIENNDYYVILMSELIIWEIRKNPDNMKKNKVLDTIRGYQPILTINDSIIRGAKELEAIGLKSIDALHVASAENYNADYFITTDDKIIKLSKKLTKKLKVKIINPIDFLREL